MEVVLVTGELSTRKHVVMCFLTCHAIWFQINLWIAICAIVKSAFLNLCVSCENEKESLTDLTTRTKTSSFYTVKWMSFKGKDYLVQDVFNSTTVVANLHSASVASAFCCHSFAYARQLRVAFCLVSSNDVAGKHSSHTC